MRIALRNARVLGTSGWRDHHAVVVDGDRIAAVIPDAEAPGDVDETIDLAGQWLVPGFVDAQVNGGGGTLFNDEPTVAGLRQIAAAHAAFGTTGMLPTLISAEVGHIDQAMRAVEQAIEAGVPGILGIHLEGPCLSPRRHGIHDPRVFRPLDGALVELFTSLRSGRTLVTLAPECAPPELVRRLADAGVIVSAGHTDASDVQVDEAIRHGVRGFTHLFNAMSPLHSRQPGVVGAALDTDKAWCGLIVDGHHVAPRTLRLALRARPLDRFMLVTDAMSSVGTEQRSFTLMDREILVKDGWCEALDGTLAGSALDMSRAVRNAVALLGLQPEQALRMASQYPAEFLRLDHHGRIAAGAYADLVVTDERLRVSQVWIGGRRLGLTGNTKL